MRAKLQIGSVTPCKAGEEVVAEQLHFHGVCRNSGYPADGLDEDNTYARFSPSVSLDIMDFTPANPVERLTDGEALMADAAKFGDDAASFAAATAAADREALRDSIGLTQAEELHPELKAARLEREKDNQ